MELYVKISFWLSVATTFLRLIVMAGASWPQDRKPKKLGEHIAETIIGIGVAIWAGIVLWLR